MRLFKSMLIAAIAIGLSSAAASAGIIVSYDNDAAGPLAVGDTVNVDVNVSYDGNPPELTGIFTSTEWDSSVLSLQGFTSAPFAIFFGSDGFLANVAQPGNFPGDPAGSLRTIQFGANPGQFGGAGPATLITTLTFEVVGLGSGDVSGTLLTGDGVFTTAGVVESGSVTLGGTSIAIVPEPGTALLMGLGLAGLGVAGRRVNR